MRPNDVIAWVLSVTAYRRLSQAQTLSILVAAALATARISRAERGRHRTGPAAAQHRLKRTWRFTIPERIAVATAMRGVVRGLLKPRRQRPVRGAFDGTEGGGFCTRRAAAGIKGRAVPRFGVSSTKGQLKPRRNAREEGLLRPLGDMLPEGILRILRADRGFGRTELARPCQELGLPSLIRIQPDVGVETRGFRGPLRDYPVPKGMGRVLRDGVSRQPNPVRQPVVIRGVEDRPERRDEPWFVRTDRERDPRSRSRLYGQRMTVAELFRDTKNRRHGWALRNG